MPPRATRSSLLFDLFAASQQVRSLLSEAMAESGLRPDEYGVYSGVFEFGPISPTELAGVVGMAPTTLSNYIAEMRQRGHIDELPNPLDGRSRMLLLTPAGLAAQKRANRAFEIAYGPFVGRIADPVAVKQALLAVETAARDTRLELHEKPVRRRRSRATAGNILDRAHPR
jgi:DNA-binding MarR family transcriptional regulator